MIGFAQNVLRESALVHDLFSQRPRSFSINVAVTIDNNLSLRDNGGERQGQTCVDGAVFSWLHERVFLA